MTRSGKTVLLSSLVIPAGTLYLKYFCDFETKQLLFPLLDDLTESWSYWLLFSIVCHLKFEGFRYRRHIRFTIYNSKMLMFVCVEKSFFQFI